MQQYTFKMGDAAARSLRRKTCHDPAHQAAHEQPNQRKHHPTPTGGGMEVMQQHLAAALSEGQSLAKTHGEEPRTQPNQCRAGEVYSPWRLDLNSFHTLPVVHNTHWTILLLILLLGRRMSPFAEV